MSYCYAKFLDVVRNSAIEDVHWETAYLITGWSADKQLVVMEQFSTEPPRDDNLLLGSKDPQLSRVFGK